MKSGDTEALKVLAVRTRPPDRVVSALQASILSAFASVRHIYCDSRSNSLVRSFIRICQVAPHDLDLDLD